MPVQRGVLAELRGCDVIETDLLTGTAFMNCKRRAKQTLARKRTRKRQRRELE